MSIPYSVRDTSITHAKVEDALEYKIGDPTTQYVLYVDRDNKRVGINKIPQEDLDVDGNIQINTSGLGRLVFYDSNDNHEHAELDADDDGTTGGQFIVKTKEDGGSVTKKMSINNVGAIGLGATPNYGTSGSVLTSNGSTALPSWTAPYYFRVYKNTNQTLTDNTTARVIDFINDTNASTSQGISDFNTTTDVWSPSIAGVYFVTAQLQIIGGGSQTTSDLLRARVRLMDDATATTVRNGEYWSDYNDDGVYNISVSFNDLLYIDGSTSYYLDAFVDRAGTGTSTISGQANGFTTWWSAHKIG